MNRLLIGLLAILVIAIGIGIGYWYQQNFEKVTKEIYVGFHGEARTNPLLAAQRFFESYQITATSHAGIAQTPPLDTTLVIPTARLQMGENESQRYLQWVEHGGHLVVSASNYYFTRGEQSDALLQAVGINLVENDFTNTEQFHEPDDVIDNDDEDTEATPVTRFQHTNMIYVDWPGRRDLLAVEMNDTYRLDISAVKHPILLALEDEIGTYLVRLKIGQGVLTILYNSYFMYNTNINRHDHAAFLWWVTQLDNAGHPLWLVYTDDMPSLLMWLWHNAWMALISFFLFLLIWLWYASQRFGPLLPLLIPTRRRLLEHVEATGRYLWANKHGQRLFAGVYHGLMRTIERRHPAWLGLPPNKLHERLATISRVPLPQVQQALSYHDNRNEHEFTKAIQTIEHIRKAL